MFKKAFQILQQLGRALMTPVAVLPAAGLLLRFGDKDLLNIPIIKDAGGVVFDNLPLIFAVGVAIGLAAWRRCSRTCRCHRILNFNRHPRQYGKITRPSASV